MTKFKSYFKFIEKKDLGNLKLLIEEDLQKILEVPATKRTKKEKKAIDYLHRLATEADNKKISYQLVKKLISL